MWQEFSDVLLRRGLGLRMTRHIQTTRVNLFRGISMIEILLLSGIYSDF